MSLSNGGSLTSDQLGATEPPHPLNAKARRQAAMPLRQAATLQRPAGLQLAERFKT